MPYSKAKHDQVQASINDASSRKQQVWLWVMAYNDESVSLHYRKAAGDKDLTRETFDLPPGPPPFPALTACYDTLRDQYTWPTRRENGELQAVGAPRGTNAPGPDSGSDD